MKEKKPFHCPKEYKLWKQEEIEELKSIGYLLQHKKSGARVLLLQNDDNNKVFSIGFRTPPKDSTGVAHIIEHTVLCGSKKFPSKDPFIELAKGSLNTFLNAMTYPDKTIFPVASCNDKDFQNLVDVYLDAVFYPNIYKEEKIFKQEGWHYELETKEGELAYNGVVYNEMKGAYSSPEQKLSHEIEKALFPESVYGLQSGGDPEVIPTLTYEEFLDFHKKYYSPSNSYLYFYGDMDMEEKLLWLDREYLSHFDSLQVDSEIVLQKPFHALRHAEAVYSITSDEKIENKSYLAYAAIIDTCLNRDYYLAFQILEYLLLDTPVAPLRKALIDAELGSDVLSFFENGILQPAFAIIIKETEPEKAEKFQEVLHKTLKELIEHGISKDSLRAAINMFEFRYREADFGQFPKGLMYGIQILDSWLYDDQKPFLHIRSNDTFAFLKEQINTDYYENLLKTYLLENQHAILLTMRPQPGLTQQLEANVRETLKKYKEGLTEDEIERLVRETKELKDYQKEPSKEEDLEKIPVLSVSDIKREVEPLYNQKIEDFDCEMLHHEIDTNGIGYFQLLFDITDIDIKQIPWMGFLCSVFGKTATTYHSLSELSNEIDIQTGGIDFNLHLYKKLPEGNKESTFTVKAVVKVKALYPLFSKALELVEEILLHSILSDEKRLKEILAEERSSMQMQMINKGHTFAMGRALSYHSKEAYFHELESGMEYYRAINDYYLHFQEKKAELMEGLKQLVLDVFVKERLLLSITGDRECLSCAKIPIKEFLEKLPSKKREKRKSLIEQILPEKKNEGFLTAGQVQYVARVGNFHKAGFEYHGSLRVLNTILSYDYLWNQVRVLGGAYGCMEGFGRDGNAYFVSYRDPNLLRTNEVFERTWEYVRDFEAMDRDMNKFIIGTISSMDTPLTPSAKGVRSLSAYLMGLTEERLKKEREQVLNTTMEKIRSFAPLVKSVTDTKEICVIGGMGEIEKNKDLFMKVEKLI